MPASPSALPSVNLLALPPGPQNNSAEDIRRGSFTFLNHTADPGWPPQWAPNGLPLLWQFNLHYFEWLWALDYADARNAVLHWIAGHPLDRNQPGWCSYPLSLRLVNWLGVFLGRDRDATLADKDFFRTLWQSLFTQTEWLFKHPEYHILGNHLLENAAALTVVGGTLGGQPGSRWQRKGERILTRQLAEQILPDGMHFERSPMYHLRSAYSLLAASHVCSRNMRPVIARKLSQMRTALDALCHPDGDIALFNDSALGTANTPAQVRKALADCLGVDTRHLPGGPVALPDAGYYGYRQDDGTYVLCDAGNIGPDYLPGHAHGDIFSFELSLKGHRVIVDAGVHDYETGAMRDYCRSTGAHNTVEIDGQDQCEFWSDFLVARRGHVQNVDWSPGDAGFVLSGSHDGYRRLPGAPTHTRTFRWECPAGLRIEDRITAGRTVQTASRLHLHPHCRVTQADAKSATIHYAAGTVDVHFEGEGRLDTEDSVYCPEFGKQLANTCLVWRTDAPTIRTSLLAR